MSALELALQHRLRRECAQRATLAGKSHTCFVFSILQLTSKKVNTLEHCLLDFAPKIVPLLIMASAPHRASPARSPQQVPPAYYSGR